MLNASLVAGAVALTMGILLFFHRLDTGGDNLDFILLARSLQWGHWSDILGWPRPAGYAGVIASTLLLLGIKLPMALFYIPPLGVYALKILNVLFFAGTAAVVCAWSYRLSQNRLIAVAVSVLLGLNQILASTASVIGAEPLFMLLVYSALLLWERREVKIPAAFIIVGLLAMTVKYQGFALAAAVAAWVVFHHKFDRSHMAVGLMFVALMATLGSCQWLGNRFILDHVTATDPYGFGEPISFADRAAAWLQTYAYSWPALLVPKVLGYRGLFELTGLEALTWPFAIAVILISIMGFVVTVRRLGLTLSHLFFLAFVGILIVWPDYLLRYLVPLAPLALWFFAEGLMKIFQSLEKIGAKFPRLLPPAGREGGQAVVVNSRHGFAVIVALLAAWSVGTNAFAGVKNWRNIVRLRHETPWHPERYRISREDDFADYMESALWIGTNLPGNAVVFCRKALFVELAAQRKAEYYSGFGSHEEMWGSISKQAAARPTYILRDSFDPASTYGRIRETQLMPVLRAHEQELELIHTTPYGSEIFRLK